MHVPLSNESKRFVDERVASGAYASVEEVVDDALRQMAEREAALSEVREKIAEGVRQADAGELIDGEEAFREIRERLIRRRDHESRGT